MGAMRVPKVNFLIFLAVVAISVLSGKNLSVKGEGPSCQNVSLTVCFDQTTCEGCMRAHSCCSWCYAEEFEYRRCDLSSHLTSICPGNFMENNKTSFSNADDRPFSNVNPNADKLDVVQIRPQEINVKLRKDEPINITFQYQPAKDFPLDLYYLMDLTLSMKNDLNTMTQLGQKLTEALTKLTKIHRIAFGSYVDKKEMPFYLTDPVNYQNPCNLLSGMQCDEGYLFKHRLNFTDEITDFISKVEDSKVSANVDNLEGGFDALMQILICHEELGWASNSRKVVLLATESMMHLAGDGILLGSVKRNTDKCLIDKEGNYQSPLEYDYPSVEEIHRQLKRRKINVIIAAKKSSIFYYQQLHELIPEATFVDELETDSTNVLQLVRDGYYDFIRRATFSIDRSIPGLEVEFFADCLGSGAVERTSTCTNVEEGKAYTFTVQLLLTQYQDRSGDILYIGERNLDERVKLEVEYVGSKCECPASKSNRSCGDHGDYICGICSCEENWTGDTCNQSCDTKLDKCRLQEEGQYHFACFGNGNCICGECHCDFPYAGQYCNYVCPFDIRTKLICGGPNQGFCVEGSCKCTEQYSGDDCSCSLSQDSCMIPGTTTMCNGHGTCECNSCKCDPGYQGRFCETCSECEGLCNVYIPCVMSMVHNQTDNCLVGNATVKSAMVNKLNDEIPQFCIYRYEGNCETRYSYVIQAGNLVDVEILYPSCYSPMTAVAPAAVVLATIIGAGLLALLIWKGVTMHRDRIEYQKFEREQKESRHREENPLYRSPIVQYNNPMEMASFSGGSSRE